MRRLGSGAGGEEASAEGGGESEGGGVARSGVELVRDAGVVVTVEVVAEQSQRVVGRVKKLRGFGVGGLTG